MRCPLVDPFVPSALASASPACCPTRSPGAIVAAGDGAGARPSFFPGGGLSAPKIHSVSVREDSEVVRRWAMIRWAGWRR